MLRHIALCFFHLHNFAFSLYTVRWMNIVFVREQSNDSKNTFYLIERAGHSIVFNTMPHHQLILDWTCKWEKCYQSKLFCLKLRWYGIASHGSCFACEYCTNRSKLEFDFHPIHFWRNNFISIRSKFEFNSIQAANTLNHIEVEQSPHRDLQTLSICDAKIIANNAFCSKNQTFKFAITDIFAFKTSLIHSIPSLYATPLFFVELTSIYVRSFLCSSHLNFNLLSNDKSANRSNTFNLNESKIMQSYFFINNGGCNDCTMYCCWLE